MFSGNEWLILVIVLLVIVVPVLLIVGFVGVARRSRSSAKLMQAPTLGQQPAAPPAAHPGWYPDPTGTAAQRFWNGQAWTDRTQ